MSKQTPSDEQTSAITEAALEAKRQVALKKETVTLAKTALKTAERELKQARKESDKADKAAQNARKKLSKSKKKSKKPKAAAKEKISKNRDQPQALSPGAHSAEEHPVSGQKPLAAP